MKKLIVQKLLELKIADSKWLKGRSKRNSFEFDIKRKSK